jgi:hypothetical protein
MSLYPEYATKAGGTGPATLGSTAHLVLRHRACRAGPGTADRLRSGNLWSFYRAGRRPRRFSRPDGSEALCYTRRRAHRRYRPRRIHCPLLQWQCGRAIGLCGLSAAVAVNHKPGIWTIAARELLTGTTVTRQLSVGPSSPVISKW